MAQRPRIALIDDEVDLLEPLAEYLSDIGYDVQTASSAAECMQILERDPIDLIVLDLNMPGEGGFDVLRRLGTTHDVAVLVLTGSPDGVDIFWHSP